MSKKPVTCVGIEYDSRGIRAAKLTGMRQGKVVKNTVDNLFELSGDFAKDEALLKGLRSIAGTLECKASDRVVACASGRQVFVTQVKNRNLPQSEMKNAMRAEIRKSLKIEVVASALDYQVMDGHALEGGGEPPITVTSVSNALISRQMHLLEGAGLKPFIMDILPAAIANSFWAGRPPGAIQKPHVMIHFSPDTCTLVIDGPSNPFYTRSISFFAEEAFGDAGRNTPASEKALHLDGLGEELRRSLTYYTTTYGLADFGLLYAIGTYVQNEALRSFVRDRLALEVDESTILERIGSSREAAAGKFEVALALAMRGTENT